MTNVEAVVSIAQTLLRYRSGARIVTITDQSIQDHITEATNLLNKDVYRVTQLEKLEAQLELFRRYRNLTI